MYTYIYTHSTHIKVSKTEIIWNYHCSDQLCSDLSLLHFVDDLQYCIWRNFGQSKPFLMNFKLAYTCSAIFTWLGKDLPSPIFVLLFKHPGYFHIDRLPMDDRYTNMIPNTWHSVILFQKHICYLHRQFVEFSSTKPAEHRGKRCIISSVSRLPVEFQGRRSSLEASRKAPRKNQVLWRCVICF